jgi:hypothetical protein
VKDKQRGGFRPGAGRTLSVGHTRDPLTFLLAVMNSSEATARLRVMAAKAALPYVHVPARRRQGLKAERIAAADRASKGRFATPQGPRKVIRFNDYKDLK